MEKLRLSYSRTSTFLWCRKAYMWCYIEGLIPRVKAQPLQVGDVVHQLFLLQFEGKLEAEDMANLDQFVQKLYPLNSLEKTLDVALQAASLFSGYLNFWVDDSLVFESPEVKVEVKGTDYDIYGKIDGLARTKDGRLWRLERKTASRMDSAFLGGLKKSLQAGVYDHLLLTTLEEKIHGTVYDILVKTKVPQYNRAYTSVNRKLIERSLQTLDGVAKDIKGGDFYPSCQCFTYERECDYSSLCNFDSPEVRESFFDKIPEKERR